MVSRRVTSDQTWNKVRPGETVETSQLPPACVETQQSGDKYNI